MGSVEGVAGKQGGCYVGCKPESVARNFVRAFFANEIQRMLHPTDFSELFTHHNQVKTK
jgi:hypothetical protein